mgnify:CR=1 FL=1
MCLAFFNVLTFSFLFSNCLLSMLPSLFIMWGIGVLFFLTGNAKKHPCSYQPQECFNVSCVQKNLPVTILQVS